MEYFGLALISKKLYTEGMVQVRKQPYTPEQLEEAAVPFHEIGARLEAIAAAARAEGLDSVDLKLGTLTGSLFHRMLDAIDNVEADARISIRKQSA